MHVCVCLELFCVQAARWGDKVKCVSVRKRERERERELMYLPKTGCVYVSVGVSVRGE